MISRVTLKEVDWAEGPQKFEAGTPFIEGALALASALDFLKDHLDFNELVKFEKSSGSTGGRGIVRNSRF